MKKIFLMLMVFSAFLFIANSAGAIPILQLDIVDGTYDGNTTIIDGTVGNFMLVALLNPDSGAYNNGSTSIVDDFYISAALVPKQDPSPPITWSNFSTYEGATTAVSTVPKYGDPGLEHGIFPTYYYEFNFKFNGYQVNSYDVSTNPTENPEPYSGSGKYLYAAYFDVNVQDLLSDANISAVHFDLYGKELNKEGEWVASNNIFAPFSHDAAATPEPATLLLLGAGLLGLAGIGRKKFVK